MEFFYIRRMIKARWLKSLGHVTRILNKKIYDLTNAILNRIGYVTGSNHMGLRCKGKNTTDRE
jgi:hypothetical protein